MAIYEPGDLITFRIQAESYGVAKVLATENLAINDIYHLAVYDTVLDVQPGEVDDYVGPVDRLHDFEGIEDAKVAIDHLAITGDALARSEPVKVGNLPSSDEELDGYRAWLQLRYEAGVRQGLFRPRAEGDVDEEVEDVAFEEDGDTSDATEETAEEEKLSEEEGPDFEVVDDESSGETTVEGGSESGASVRSLDIRAWHSRLFEIPLGDALFELHEDIAGAGLGGTGLGSLIAAEFDEGNLEKIEQLVEDFVEGDYAAGHELLRFGDHAAEALGKRLPSATSPELVGDILQILGDLGRDSAYEQIASFFAIHGLDPEDQFAPAAVRGYCYAVMLTGGTPDPLRQHLARLDDIDMPDLAHDITMAREAVRNAPDQETDQGKGASSDPFGNR